MADRRVTPQMVKSWLSEPQETGFVDVREPGQYGHAHPFFVSCVPFSVLEDQLPRRVPNLTVRLVLMDNGDGVAELAAERAQSLGYTNIYVLDGGAPAWAAAGFTLYAGVNVPSKAFAEVMELARHTPSMPAADVARLAEQGTDHVILDGRPLAEFHKMSIPGATCCPNGELALRIDNLVPDKKTTVIVNCAGRTRSIIGAQTLIDSGIPNPVYALENGTQGWVLAGLQRAHGATEQYGSVPSPQSVATRCKHAQELARTVGVSTVSAARVAQWLKEPSRTTYLLDVRTPEEFAHDGLAQSVHAPGGQLVQGTDEWIGVRGARVVLLDDEMLRAPMSGYWLAQMGHSVFVVDGGVPALTAINLPDVAIPSSANATAGRSLRTVSADQLNLANAQVVDLRASATYREAHIDGAQWSIRPRIGMLGLDPDRSVVLTGPPLEVDFVARDLQAQGYANVCQLTADVDTWCAAGLPVVSTGDSPPDAERIDHLFFTAERHTGNEAHSRQYLDWELNLVHQLDDQERLVYRIAL